MVATLAALAALAVLAATALPGAATADVGSKAASQQVDEWIQAGNVAAYAGLEYTRSLNIPVVINLVFVGFDRNGHLGIELSQEKLKRYFWHLEASLPFMRLPSSNPPGDSSAASGAQQRSSFTPIVRFRYSFNVMKVSPNVTHALDNILVRAMRPTDPLDVAPLLGPEAVFYQVEAGVMEEALESLAAELSLDTGAFTLFVLNPKRERHGRMYGYRSGLSAAEKALLMSDEGFRSTYRYGSLSAAQEGGGGGGAQKSAEAVARQAGLTVADAMRAAAAEGADDDTTVLDAPQLSWHDLERQSEAWLAAQSKSSAAASSAAAEAAATAAGAGGAVYRRAVRMLEARGEELREIDALFADQKAAAASAASRGAPPSKSAADFDENCLVDMWVASDRVAWIDLTAGPFTWGPGPALGGAGLKTHASLPSVSEMVEGYQRPVDEMLAQPKGGVEDQPLLEFISQLSAEREVLSLLYQRHCLLRSAGIPPPTPLPSPPQHTGAAAGTPERTARPTPEWGVGAFTGRPDLCQEMRRRRERLASVLQRARSQQGADPQEGPPKPPRPNLPELEKTLQHTKNKDGDTPIFTKDVLGSDAASFAVDRALSQLAAVMSKTLRQLVTPMAAQVDLEAADALTNGWEHDDGDRAAAAAQQTSATLYSERVAFHIFMITEHTSLSDGEQPSSASGAIARSKKGKAPSRALLAIKSGLLRLKLPSQEFSFSFSAMSLADDPALAVAYSTSLRMDARSEGGPLGEQTVDALTIDAAELIHQLQHRAAIDRAFAGLSPSARSRTIPIFIFNVDSELPVFVTDGSLVAGAGGGDTGGHAVLPKTAVGHSGMVIAVESNHSRWRGGLVCNGRALGQDLRQSLKPVLTATARVLGGLLPREAAADVGTPSKRTDEWLWSVGDSPQVSTSSRASFGETDRDALHRNYLAAALEHTARRANRMLDELASSRGHTRRQNAAAAFAIDWRALTAMHKELKKHWVAALSLAGRLDFDGACKRIRPMEEAADAFHAAAVKILDRLTTGAAAWQSPCDELDREALHEVRHSGADAVAAGGGGSWSRAISRWCWLCLEAALLAVCLCGLRWVAVYFSGTGRKKPKFN